MGSFAEDGAEHYQFSREHRMILPCSLGRVQAATQDGKLAAEICTITIETKKGCHLVDTDEQPQLASPEKIPLLKPAFRENGTVTAANSSSISDGAAALCLASGSAVQAHGLPVRARICGHAGFAQPPAVCHCPCPCGAQAAGRWAGRHRMLIFEVNEAFMVVAMAFIRELGFDREQVNIFGGACALILSALPRGFWSAC